MGVSWSELHRIVCLVAYRELSDAARGLVSTSGDEDRAPGQMVEDALGLVDRVDEVLRLAVAAERAGSTPWQAIGERLGVSRQSAHQRFARAVQEISDGVLFPTREPERTGGVEWWACPDGVEDPAATVRALDAWALRHREPSDPDRGEHPVSDGLDRREDLATDEAVGVVNALARRLTDGDLPPGVSTRHARRVLLEQKIEAFDMIARRDSGRSARDASAQAAEAFQQLVAWHREDLDRRLTAAPLDDGATESYRFLLDELPVARLEFTTEGSRDDTGWFLWFIDTTASPAKRLLWLGQPWPLDVAGVDVDELVAAAATHDRPSLRAQAGRIARRTRSEALHAARAQLLADLASDRAKRAGAWQHSDQAGADVP